MGSLFNLSGISACVSSLSTMWTSSASSSKSDASNENALLSTMLSTTTSSVACGSDKGLAKSIAERYIDSLSVDELVALSEKIEAKESIFVEEEKESKDVVVKVKVDNKKRI